MTKKEQLKALTEKMVTDVLEDFDFQKVHRIMKTLDWKWSISDDEMCVPGVYRIMKRAESLLYGVMKYYGDGAYHAMGCGGLRATLEAGFLTLTFTAVEASADPETYDEYLPHGKEVEEK